MPYLEIIWERKMKRIHEKVIWANPESRRGQTEGFLYFGEKLTVHLSIVYYDS
jgi:hypothetical protein